MSLIVENGTGKSDAESYVSVTDADTYHSNRSNTTWAALSTAAKESALRKATDYMVGNYRLKWKGRRVLSTQSLDWPRAGVILEEYNVYPSYGLFQVSYTIVPNEVKNACAELALRVSVGTTLADDITQQAIKKTVGPITVEYSKDAPVYTVYRQIDMMLKAYLMTNGATVKLVRT